MRSIRCRNAVLCSVFFIPAICAADVRYVTSPATGKVITIINKEPAPPSTLTTSRSKAESTSASSAAVSSAAAKGAASVLDPAAAASAFVNRYGRAFGVDNAAADFSISRVDQDSSGISHVRFRQQYRGIPVYGGEIIAHVGADGEVLSVNGSTGAGISGVSRRPKISALQAIKAAKREFAKLHPGIRPKVFRPELRIFQPGLINNTRDPKAYLVYAVRIINRGAIIDKEFSIDATNGAVLYVYNDVRTLDRRVYDCSTEGRVNPQTGIVECWSDKLAAYNEFEPWTPPPYTFRFGCRENTCPRTPEPNPRYLPEQNFDTETLFDFMGDIHAYYLQVLNRNGANGQGGNVLTGAHPVTRTLGQTYINFSPVYGPNCLTAQYWTDGGIIFCKGLVVADVVAHEYAHGVTPLLNYSGESASVDESHSDMMAEFFEYWRYGQNDWLMSGFLPNLLLLRNFADPPALTNPNVDLPYPDTFYSSGLYCGGGSFPHHNSTVLSKALYLASVGGVHNGCAIDGITHTKVSKILHRAKTSTYPSYTSLTGAYTALIQACQQLYGAQSDECSQLTRALQAVELDQAGRCADPSLQLKRPASCRVPSCTNLVYHPDYNPNEPTLEARRNLCLRLGYKYAGVVLNVATGQFDWYGNCRAQSSSGSWNSDPYYTLDLSTCGAAPPAECIDTDGGQEYLEYFTAGRAGKTASGPWFDQDYCQKGGDPNGPSRAYYVSACAGSDPECYLIEMKCGQYGLAHQAYHCPNGCSEGKCNN